MADDTATVKIVAAIEGLQSGLSQASSLVGEALDSIKDKFGEVHESAESFQKSLSAVLAGGEFLIFKEIAETALEAVRGAFEATVGKATEWEVATATLAAKLGVSMESAANLDSAMKAAGTSGDAYVQMATKLDRQVRSNEQGVNDLGVKTRDASGALLDQTTLMNNALEAWSQYKAGTDQAMVGLTLFGRSTGDIVAVHRAMTENLQEDFKKIDESMEVSMGQKAVENATEFEAAGAKLHATFEDFAVALGQRLTPVVTQLVEWFQEVSVPVLNAVRVAIEGIVAAIDAMVTGWSEAYAFTKGVIEALVELLSGFALAADDALHGRFGQASADFQASFTKAKDAFVKGVQDMIAINDEFLKRNEEMFNGPQGKDKEPGKGFGTGGTKDAPDKDANKADLARAEEAEKAALERVKIEQDANQSLYNLGQKSLEDFISQAEQLEDQRYSIVEAGLRKRIALEGTDKTAQAKDQGELEVLALQHQANLQKIEEQGAQQRMQLSQQELQEDIQAGEKKVTEGIAHDDALVKAHQLSADQAFDLERQLTNQVYGELQKRLDAELATLAKGTKAYEQAKKEQEKLTAQYDAQIQRINDKQNQEDMALWNKLGSTVRSSWESAMNGMIMGTETWQQALGKLLDSVLSSFLKLGEDWLADWVAKQAESLFTSEATNATQLASNAATQAASAAMGAYAATAAIPYVGPELAPAAAAEAFTGVMAFAERGMLVDQDRPVFTHKDEMILPAPLSKGIQGLIAGGGGGGSATLNYSPTINGGGGLDLAQALRTQGSAMTRWYSSAMRDGKLRAR